MNALRESIRCLQSGRALVLFAPGKIDPDPTVAPGAERDLEDWSSSIPIFLRQVPDVQIVLCIAGGVLARRFVNHPITRLREEPIDKRRLAEFLQILNQVLFNRDYHLHPMIMFSPIFTLAELTDRYPGEDILERTGQRGEIDVIGIQPDQATRGCLVISNKIPAMNAAMQQRGLTPQPLKPEYMADIVAYLYSVRYFADPGSITRGWALATEKGCLVCHGVFGERGKPASDLTRAKGMDSPAGVIAALWNHTLVQPPAISGKRPEWPRFRPQEMAALVSPAPVPGPEVEERSRWPPRSPWPPTACIQ